MKRWLERCCWLYALGVLAVLLLMQVAGDRWWPATVALFGPRWVWCLPLLALAPAAILARRRALWPLVGATVLLGPVTGLCMGHGASPANGAGRPFRVLTANVDTGGLDAKAMNTLIEQTKPDIVTFQEWGTGVTDDPDIPAVDGPSWHRLISNDHMYIASRFPILKSEVIDGDSLGGGNGVAVHYALETPAGLMDVFNVHLATPREGLEPLIARERGCIGAMKDNIAVRWQESQTVRRRVDQCRGPVLVVGDFNLTSDSAIFKTCWGSLSDAYSATQWGWGYSKFTRWYGARIDHVLTGAGWHPLSCWVGPDVGSDHRPLVADLTWTGS